jgi:N-acetylglutamate synthase-like GNAT family acetyltransferase
MPIYPANIYIISDLEENRMLNTSLRKLTPEDAPWVHAFWIERWGSDLMVVHGQTYTSAGLPGFVVEANGQVLGVATYRIENDECELMSLDSLIEGQGIGSQLLEAVIEAARQAGLRRLYLSTTNDNMNALRFYQKRGFRLCALRPGAVMETRKIKPAISLVGMEGIPIRDELELEKDL